MVYYSWVQYKKSNSIAETLQNQKQRPRSLSLDFLLNKQAFHEDYQNKFLKPKSKTNRRKSIDKNLVCNKKNKEKLPVGQVDQKKDGCCTGHCTIQ